MTDIPDQMPSAKSNGREAVLSAKGVNVAFGSNVVLKDLDLDIWRGEILGFIGPSGTGKSVLMRSILRLLPRQSGTITILGHNYDTVSVCDRIAVLGNKKVMVSGTIEDMLSFDEEWVQSYFHGKRARSIVPREDSVTGDEPRQDVASTVLPETVNG